MRVATIDIGTNSVLMLVADVHAERPPAVVQELATITRLGEGVDKTRTLAKEAIQRTTACLEQYARAIEGHRAQRVAIVGTSAMRDAEGSDGLREFIHTRFGVEVRIISGEEEARLTFEGSLAGLAVAKDDDTIVFDIGGGSTEIVRGRPGAKGSLPSLSYAASVDMGSVRLTERHLPSDPPTAAELDALRKEARAVFASLPRLESGSPPAGLAGTITTLAAVAHAIQPYDGDRVHGMTLKVGEIRDVAARLASLPLAERRKLPGMEPKRADVIVAGAELTLIVLETLGASALRVSDRGVRWGLALEMARSR